MLGVVVEGDGPAWTQRHGCRIGIRQDEGRGDLLAGCFRSNDKKEAGVTFGGMATGGGAVTGDGA